MLPSLYINVFVSHDKNATILINEHRTLKKTREMTTAEIIHRTNIISIERNHMCPNSYIFCVLMIWVSYVNIITLGSIKFISIRQLIVYQYTVGANTKKLSDYEKERSR